MSLRDNFVSVMREVVQTALVSLGIFFFVYIFFVQPHRVKGDSMLPNFVDGELLLTEKVSYRLYKPSRGDVIVFKAPGPRNVDFIKRIIGLPHETVKIGNGDIYVSGVKIKEPYEIQSTDGSLNIILGDDQYFVLGDNRRASSDSRSFGAVEKKTIKGRAWLVYWPIFAGNNFKGARIVSRVDYGIPDMFED